MSTKGSVRDKRRVGPDPALSAAIPYRVVNIVSWCRVPRVRPQNLGHRRGVIIHRSRKGVAVRYPDISGVALVRGNGVVLLHGCKSHKDLRSLQRMVFLELGISSVRLPRLTISNL